MSASVVCVEQPPLLSSSFKVGARVVILSPTRELALQTLKFAKEVCVRACVCVCVCVYGSVLLTVF